MTDEYLFGIQRRQSKDSILNDHHDDTTAAAASDLDWRHRAADRRRKRNVTLHLEGDVSGGGGYRYHSSSDTRGAPGAHLNLSSFVGQKKKKKKRSFTGLPGDRDAASVAPPSVVIFGTLFALFVFYKLSLGLGKNYTDKSGGDSDTGNYIRDENRVIQTFKYAAERGRHPSIQEEEMDFEFLPLGENRGSIAVPQFHVRDVDRLRTGGGFSGSGNLDSIIGDDGRLLTRRAASILGSYSNERKNADARTIFVGIVSHRDWRCRRTVENLFSRAKNPDRVRVGVVDQLDEVTDVACDVPIEACDEHPEQSLCKFKGQIDVYKMDSRLSAGHAFARHIANRLYRGEYYALQINAQVEFVQDWDTDIVAQFEQAGNEMAVLTTYLKDAHDNLDESGNRVNFARVVICHASYEGFGTNRVLRHRQEDQKFATATIHGKPLLQPFWSSSFSFSRGHFILTVPYDLYLPMTAPEHVEISMALRAFTHGYDCYVPELSICYHNSFDEEGIRAHEKGVVLSDLEHSDPTTYLRIQRASLARLYGIIKMGPSAAMDKWNDVEAERYGLGKVREVTKFFSCFGIHVKEQSVETKLCDFVSSGTMNARFSKFLRNDGMGLDYSRIHFRFHDRMYI